MARRKEWFRIIVRTKGGQEIEVAKVRSLGLAEIFARELRQAKLYETVRVA